MGDGDGCLSSGISSAQEICINESSVVRLLRLGARGSFCGELLWVVLLLLMIFATSGAMLSLRPLARKASVTPCSSGFTKTLAATRNNVHILSRSSNRLVLLRSMPARENDADDVDDVDDVDAVPMNQVALGDYFGAQKYEQDENDVHYSMGRGLPSLRRNSSITSKPATVAMDEANSSANVSAECDSPRFNDSFLEIAAEGYGVTKTVDILERQLEEVQRKVFERNHGVEFNINSNPKLSRVLFGPQGGSTEKAVLEAKAASGDRMADLVLQYRSLKQQITRLKRREANVKDGSQASSPSAVARVNHEEDHGADPLMLIDASSYIFRAYYSMPPIHRAIDGMPTGAVLGFCNMLNKLALSKMVSGEKPRLVLVFDAKGKTFRHELYKDYKSHRPEAPMDLIPQFALVRQAAQAYGICQIEAPSYEADDAIATLARMAVEEGLDVNVFSGDKDLMQLVSENGLSPSVQMIDPATMKRYTHETVVEKWGVPPSQLGDLLALAGDSADNVPGVPGIGPKTAAQLLKEFGTLETLLQSTDRIKQNGRRSKLEEFRDQARLSRRLVNLCDDVPLDLMTFPGGAERVGDLRMSGLDEDRLFRFYDDMGFQDIRRRVEARLMRGKRPHRSPGAGSYRRPKATVPAPGDIQSVPF